MFLVFFNKMSRNFFKSFDNARATRQERIDKRVASYAKRGRKKKRRRRKQPKQKERVSMKKPFRLILAYNNKQKASLGAFKTYVEALAKMNELISEADKNVLVPCKTITTNRIADLETSIILIKYRDENDPQATKVRDEYGEFITHESTSDKFLVIEKKPYKIEETFWVYGFHPKYDRKDAYFIYDNLIYPIASSKHDFLNIKLYKNKIFLSSQEGNNLIITKRKSDAIRLYNVIEEKTIKDKRARHIIFCGDCNTTTLSRETIIKEITDFTHWNIKKIQRSTTKP